MSDFMKIDDAIRKYQSYANLNKQLAESQRSKGDINFYKKQKRIQAENLQIVSWLKELKSTRKLIASERKDEADCDGNCLKEDIENYFDEYGEDGDAE